MLHLKKCLSLLVCICFFSTLVTPPGYTQALMGRDLAPLPRPGSMVALSSSVNPPVLRGIKVFTNNPLNFDFILDPGNTAPGSQAQLKETTDRLLRYFLTTLTVPDNDIWVNLSPYEKDRIISRNFGLTEMGRDLLGQDYLLKQITASLMFPEGEAGKKFWARVYEEAQKKFGSTQIPVNTFNKVWVMPDKAIIYEKLSGDQATAFVVESRLKVMLESDYMAAQKRGAGPLTDTQKLSRDVAREVIIPILQKEVNEGRNFAPLRQIYNSILLALWYKERMKGSILSSAYVNHSKIAGVNVEDRAVAKKIWQRYVQAYKKGAFNFIREEKDTATDEVISRKYFSGGFNIDRAQLATEYINDNTIKNDGVSRRSFMKMLAVLSATGLMDVTVGCVSPMRSIFNFPDLKTINIAPTSASNDWGYNAGVTNGVLTVEINYGTPAQQNTIYSLLPNGTITSPSNGTNTTYMYNTPQGENILLTMVNILNFMISLSPESGTPLNGVIKIIQDKLPIPFADVNIIKSFNYAPTSENFTINPETDLNGTVTLQINEQIPEQALNLGPNYTSTTTIDLTSKEVISYDSDLYPAAYPFQPNTDEWANVLYWELLDLQNAITTGQNKLSTAQIDQMQEWYNTINGWYLGYFAANGQSVKDFEAKIKSADRAMNVSRRSFIAAIAKTSAVLAISSGKTWLEAQYGPNHANPFIFEKSTVWDGSPKHQKAIIYGATHPNTISVNRFRELVENIARFKNSQTAKNLLNSLAAKRDFIVQFHLGLKRIEQDINNNPDIKAFGTENMVFNRPQKLDVDNVRRIKTAVTNAITSLFEGDKTVNINRVVDDILIYTLSPQQYLALTNPRIANMPSIGIENETLLKEQMANDQLNNRYLDSLVSAVRQGSLSGNDLQFLINLYTYPEINNAKRQEIEQIRKRASAIYQPTIDDYVQNYVQYLNIVQQRSVAMAKNIHAFGSNIIVPVGDFHYRTLIKTLKTLDGIPTKAGEATRPNMDLAVNGGIDLTRNSTPLDVRNQGGAVNFNIDPAQVESILAAPGLSPKIYTIEPLQNLSDFLGINKAVIE